jgi:hypothetical protein
METCLHDANQMAIGVSEKSLRCEYPSLTAT